VTWNAVGFLHLSYEGLQITVILFEYIEEEIEENVVYLLLSILYKLLLELLSFQLHDVVLDEPVPAEPVLLHHSVENLYIVYRLNLFEFDSFAPVQCGYVCPYT
jgi:hypothetical protein